MSAIHYYLVELPEHGLALTWIGGALKQSDKPGWVWLCTPAGERVLQIDRRHVRPCTREELAERIRADALAAKAAMN